MGNLEKSVNNVEYMSDCMIEIYNTQTITFGYQRDFSSQFVFKVHLAWNVFHC